MCRDHEHGERRCRCCDPAARRAARREKRMCERGHEGDVDEQFAAMTVGGRAERADLYPEAAYDPSPTVRAAAARGPLSEEAEGALAGDESPRVRRALATNPACSAEALDLLSGDADPGVRVAVARHRSTPPAALAGMAADLDRRRDLGIARALAGNPRTPFEALETMAQTGTGGWKALARRALRERTEGAAGAVLDGAGWAGALLDETRAATADNLDEVLGLSPAKVR